jgi:hypothetical protein
MYYCQKCKKLSKSGESTNTVVTKKRPKQYWGFRFNKDRNMEEKVMLGEGWEIVSEEKQCKRCFNG